MDDLELQQNEGGEGAGVDDIVIAALEQALEYARSKRAESVMAPQPDAEAPPPGADDAQMAELEQMLAEPPAGPPKPEDEEETE